MSTTYCSECKPSCRGHRPEDADTLETPINLMVVHLTHAAGMVLAAQDVGGSPAQAALNVWASLTGLDDDSALQYAYELMEHPTPPITASVAPF